MTKHDGGPCPVAAETRVRIYLRDGYENSGAAEDFDWDVGGDHPGDIIGYDLLDAPAALSEDVLREIARAICKSRTCEGFSCCQWPAQMGRRHKCPVDTGAYDGAAIAAFAAMSEAARRSRSE